MDMTDHSPPPVGHNSPPPYDTEKHADLAERVEKFMAACTEARAAGAIRARREAERDLFRDGRYPTGTIPFWAVDRSGRVDFSRPIRRLTETEALAFLRPTSQPVPLPVPLPVPTQPPAAPSWWHRLMKLFTGKATS